MYVCMYTQLYILIYRHIWGKATNDQQFGQVVAFEWSKAAAFWLLVVGCWQLVAGANLMAISWTDCQTHANNSLVQQLATHFRQSATDRGSQPSRARTDETDRQTDSWTVGHSFHQAVGQLAENRTRTTSTPTRGPPSIRYPLTPTSHSHSHSHSAPLSG